MEHEYVDLTVTTPMPNNWLFVDRESGMAWEKIDGQWHLASVQVLVLPQIPAMAP